MTPRNEIDEEDYRLSPKYLRDQLMQIQVGLKELKADVSDLKIQTQRVNLPQLVMDVEQLQTQVKVIKAVSAVLGAIFGALTQAIIAFLGLRR